MIRLTLSTVFVALVLGSHAEEFSETSGVPRLHVASEDILETKVVPCGEREMILCKVRPLKLPPIPEPKPRELLSAEKHEALQELIPESYRNRKALLLGATTYIVDEGEHYTKLRYWTERGRKPVEMWLNINATWLGGMMDFSVGDQTWSIMMASSIVDLREVSEERRSATGNKAPEITAYRNRLRDNLEIPSFPANSKATYRVTQGRLTWKELAPIRAMLRLYDREKDNLKTIHAQRQADAERRRQERLADPPERKNIVVRYWRLDQAGEGTKPATFRRTSER